MTTYSTGNPVGSPDPRDLYDNAENLDTAANSDDATWTDRLGQSRRTMASIEQDAVTAIQNAGYVGTGADNAIEDYAADIEITQYNQIVRDGGEFWRVSGSETLPYTLTGAGVPEGGALVSVGDAALRQELADPAQGGGLVGITTATGEQTIGQLTAYLLQIGVPEWNGEQEFNNNSLTNRNGILYVCKTNSHVSTTPPEDDSTNWRPEERDGFKIGAYQEIQTNLTGAQEPDQSRWIKLTAGEDGSGQYNEGKLVNETITGSGDTVVITAEIDDSDSPMNGETIYLINSENRYVSPGENAGTVANDQMQQITGNAGSAYGGSSSFNGAFDDSEFLQNIASDGNEFGFRTISFDSADSPDARTGTNTNVKRIQVTAYLKFKE